MKHLYDEIDCAVTVVTGVTAIGSWQDLCLDRTVFINGAVEQIATPSIRLNQVQPRHRRISGLRICLPLSVEKLQERFQRLLTDPR
jgi:hypothetical protein